MAVATKKDISKKPLGGYELKRIKDIIETITENADEYASLKIDVSTVIRLSDLNDTIRGTIAYDKTNEEWAFTQSEVLGVRVAGRAGDVAVDVAVDVVDVVVAVPRAAVVLGLQREDLGDGVSQIVVSLIEIDRQGAACTCHQDLI